MTSVHDPILKDGRLEDSELTKDTCFTTTQIRFTAISNI